MSKVIDEATQIVENRMSKLITDSEGPGYFHGHYEGLGFQSESVCLDKSCKYYKYIASIGWRSVCTHPNVIQSTEIGGVYKCPKSTVERGIEKFIKSYFRHRYKPEIYQKTDL